MARRTGADGEGRAQFLVGCIGLVLSPVMLGYYFGVVKGKPRQERAFKILVQLNIIPAIQASRPPLTWPCPCSCLLTQHIPSP